MFKKGEVNNVKGRPRGSKNRFTEKCKEEITKFVSKNLKTIQIDFEKLTPKERCLILEKFLQYIMPKALAVDVTTEGEKLTPDFQIEIIDKTEDVNINM